MTRIPEKFQKHDFKNQGGLKKQQTMVDKVKEKIEDGGIQELNKLLLFEERNRLYLLFFFYISALKLVSSFFYMGICANRHKPLDDMKVTYYALIFFEFCFLVEIIL